MDFVKMEGLGNDFVVVEGPVTVDATQVRRWCDRRRGIGGDGVLEVSPVGPGRVRMRYWNADGSPAEMCGNGLRCVARLAVERGWVAEPRFVVETAVGDRDVAVAADGTVRAFLGVPRLDGEVPLDVAGAHVHRVDMGNPHAVVLVDDPASAPVAELGPRIEHDAHFPHGTNVEFAVVRSPERIELRVWERGVGETLACGTGAAATAYLAHRLGHTAARTTVELRGGRLIVDLDDAGAWLEGPATVVFSGRWPEP